MDCWLRCRAGSGVRCCCCCPLKVPTKSRALAYAQAHCLYVDADAAVENRAAVEVERAALRYDKNSPSCMGLDAFEGASMAP